MPTTPTPFSSMTYQGVHASFHADNMIYAPPLSVCEAPKAMAPNFFGGASGYQQGFMPLPMELGSSPVPASAVANPVVDAMRSFLTGGLAGNEADIAMCLQASLPEVYED